MLDSKIEIKWKIYLQKREYNWRESQIEKVLETNYGLTMMTDDENIPGGEI